MSEGEGAGDQGQETSQCTLVHTSVTHLSTRTGRSARAVLTCRQMRMVGRDIKRINLLGLQDILYLVAGLSAPVIVVPELCSCSWV